MDTEELQEAEQIINRSFLSERSKQALREFAKTAHSIEEFDAKLDEMLAQNVNQRSDVWENTANQEDDAFRNANEEYVRMRADLDAKLERDLDQLDPADFPARDALFKEYYQNTDGLQKTNMDSLKSHAIDQSHKLASSVSELN